MRPLKPLSPLKMKNKKPKNQRLLLGCKMPTSTIWFRVGKTDAMMYKALTGNASLVKRPEITQAIAGVEVCTKRVVAKGHWEEVGTGEKLIVETVLKNSKGEVVPTSKAKNIIDKYENQALDDKDKEVNKAAIEDFILLPDGGIGDKVMPYAPTDRFEALEDPSALDPKKTGQGYWVPSTFMEKFLIHEEYTLSCANPRDDADMYAEVEDALKRDEVILTTYSNGSYKLYYAFISPYVDTGKYTWRLRISDKQLIYNGLRDIPGPAAAIKQAKVLETLPPLAGLLTVPTRR